MNVGIIVQPCHHLFWTSKLWYCFAFNWYFYCHTLVQGPYETDHHRRNAILLWYKPKGLVGNGDIYMPFWGQRKACILCCNAPLPSLLSVLGRRSYQCILSACEKHTACWLFVQCIYLFQTYNTWGMHMRNAHEECMRACKTRDIECVEAQTPVYGEAQ